MSKESYARGFVKAAAAAGVDPTRLAKYAQWYNPLSWFTNDQQDRSQLQPSGIGTENDNAIGLLISESKKNLGRNEARSYGVQPINYPGSRNPGLVPTSYFGRLLRNTNEDPSALSALNEGTPRKSTDYSLEENDFFNRDMDQRKLDYLRRRQASKAASKFFPRESAPFNELMKNLIVNGSRNQESYKRTGDVEPRKEVDRTGIEDLKLTPEQEKLLKLIQDSMARKGPTKTKGNIA